MRGISMFHAKKRQDVARAEQVSRAVQMPGQLWDEETTALAAVAPLLEAALAPDETARAERKAAMLAEFARLHGRTSVPDALTARPVVIADIESVDEADAVAVAARFQALLEQTHHHRQ